MSALGEFLRSRRGRIGPVDAGLPVDGRRRRTPGLRRAELAALAGVSVDYYIRLEQGRDTNPGAGILDALAVVLRLDDGERAHLHRLVHDPDRPDRHHDCDRPDAVAVPARDGLLHLLEAVRPAPAWVLDQVGNLLAANPEGGALLVGIEDWPAERRNVIRYVFTHPAARGVFDSWAQLARDCVADLRSRRGAAALVAELAAHSPEFAELWLRYDVRANEGGLRTVGRSQFATEILTAVDGQRLVTFREAGAEAAG